MKITAISKRIVENKYINLTINQIDYTIKITNGNIVGIYEHFVEITDEGHMRPCSENIGCSIKKLTGMKRRDFLKMIGEIEKGENREVNK